MSRKKRSSAVQDQFRNSLLRLLQENPEVSKADVSRACNVTRSAVSKWVDGTSAIGVDNVPDLCDFFNITIDDFSAALMVVSLPIVSRWLLKLCENVICGAEHTSANRLNLQKMCLLTTSTKITCCNEVWVV